MVKHSSASRFNTLLKAENDGGWPTVEMTVVPTGRSRGFRHLGRLGVCERLAALVGGSRNVESTARSGTTAYVRVPFASNA